VSATNCTPESAALSSRVVLSTWRPESKIAQPTERVLPAAVARRVAAARPRLSRGAAREPLFVSEPLRGSTNTQTGPAAAAVCEAVLQSWELQLGVAASQRAAATISSAAAITDGRRR